MTVGQYALTGLLSITALLINTCSATRSPSDQLVKSDEGLRRAPDFTLKDAEGKTVRVSDYKGQVLLLDFWATWCPPCRYEIPWFKEFELRYKARGFSVLGVSMDKGGWNVVRPFISAAKVNYRIVLGDLTTGQSYGWTTKLPTTVLIDRQGKIAFTHVGLVSKREFQASIEKLLSCSLSGRCRCIE